MLSWKHPIFSDPFNPQLESKHKHLQHVGANHLVYSSFGREVLVCRHDERLSHTARGSIDLIDRLVEARSRSFVKYE